MWTYEKPDNLVEWWLESEKKFSANALFLVRNSEGSLDKQTYGEIGTRIKNARGGLAKLGIKKNDAVGIISANRPEWAVLAFATYGRNARYIPMYEKELLKTWKYIIKDSAIKFLLVSTPLVYEKVKHFKDEIESLENIYIIESDGPESLAALEKLGEENPAEPLIPHYDDIAVLIYTSGTTGAPKGVLLSHGNLTYCSRGGYKIYPELNETQIGISMLPWAHSYALSGELNNWIQFGGALGFMRDVTTLAEDFQLIRPTYMISVPRVFNKIYDGIQRKMDDAGGAKKKLFDAACRNAKQKRELAGQGKSKVITNIKAAIFDKLVFSKIRAAFGGRLTGSLTASAVMNREIGEFFLDIGIPIYDCYGLTETSPAVSMNCSAAWRLGSVGKVLEGQKVVIDKAVLEGNTNEGEIVVYGPNVMKGYHRMPGETQKVLMKDGGFRTGDRGRFDEDGFLWITGRIKEQYKLQNGKYVFPAVIEEEMKLMPHVANAMIYGDGQAYNISLVFPDYEFAARWAAAKGVSAQPEDLVANKEFTDMMEYKITEHLKKTFGGYEVPKRFIFLENDFSVENNMLTQTLKLKRGVVIENYLAEINQLYLPNRTDRN
jgi:long-chain acyl-CoA synthetase